MSSITIVVDPEFQSLLPPLPVHDRELLEQSLLADGCREPLMLWAEEGILLDGHNRYEICRRLTLPYDVTRLSFASRDDAKAWMIKNQIGRRNLTEFQRIEFAEMWRDATESAARERQRKAGGDKTGNAPQPDADAPRASQKSGEENRTRMQLAKIAQVSGGAMARGEKLLRDGTDELKSAVREGKISLTAGALLSNLPPENQKEVATAAPPEIRKAISGLRRRANGETDYARVLMRAVNAAPPKSKAAAAVAAMVSIWRQIVVPAGFAPGEATKLDTMSDADREIISDHIHQAARWLNACAARLPDPAEMADSGNSAPQGGQEPAAPTGESGSTPPLSAADIPATPAETKGKGKNKTKSKPPKPKTEPPTATLWESYATAYLARYGVDPVRNAKVNGQLAQLLGRLGADEAPQVAEFYVRHSKFQYVSARHSVNLLLRDAEGLRTEWATGNRVTDAQARQSDRKQSIADAFAPLLTEAEEREGIRHG